jgi:thioredoxin reductase (NADPH)
VLIHRRESLRADKTNQLRLERNPKIRVLWNSTVEEVLGDGNPKAVIGIRVKNHQTGSVDVLPRDGLFVAIGHSPATEIFRGQLDMDDDGYIRTASDSTKTSVPGVFAAGDVKDKIFRQAVTAAGMGCMAALEAEKFLAAHH